MALKNRLGRRSHWAGETGAAAALGRGLHEYFRKFEGRSLADELIAERREETHREASDLDPPSSITVKKGGFDADGSGA